MSTPEERQAWRDAQRAKVQEAIAIKREEEEEVLFKLQQEKNWVLGHDIWAIFAVNTGKMVVVKKPPSVVHKTYTKATGKNGVNEDDSYDMVKACLVYPTLQELNAIIEETPAMISLASDKCLVLAGFSKENLEGKSS